MAIVFILAIGSIFAVSANAVSQPTCSSEEPLFVQSYSGCESYCSWCKPLNGDGACTPTGACC